MQGITHALHNFTKPQETKEKKHHLVQSQCNMKVKANIGKKFFYLHTLSPEQQVPQNLQQIQCQAQLQFHDVYGIHHQKPQR